MATDAEWITRTQQKKSDMSMLHDRQDVDMELYYKDSYTMTDSYKNDIPEVYNIYMPDARQYADNIISNLTMAEVIPEITGDEFKDDETILIEQWFDDIMEVNDENLKNLGIGGGLHGAQSGQVPMRGWLYTKVYPYYYKDKFYPGIVPWDSRYSGYDSGINGLNWMNNETYRSKDKINAQYPGVNVTGDCWVNDIITTDECIIIIDGKKWKRFNHKFGFCPGVVEFNPASAFMRDEGYIEHEGESIFSSVRDLYDALDRVASALITVTMRSFNPNIQHLSDDPEGADPDSLEENPFGERNVFGMKRGERLEYMSIPDLKRTIIYILNLIQTYLQRGSLPSSDYGSVSQPLAAVAIKELGDKRNRVLGPCLSTIARSRERIYRMLLKMQLAKNFKHPDIRVPDKNILKKKMKIKVNMEYIPAIEQIANYTVADAATPYMDKLDRMKTILKIRDAEKKYLRKQAEDTVQLAPELLLIDGARAWIELGDKAKAAALAGKLQMSLKEVQGKGLNTGKIYQSQFNREEQTRSKMMDLYESGGNRQAPGQPSSQEQAAQMVNQQGMNQGG